MVRVTLSITTARSESPRLVEALRLLMVPAERERGCVGSQLWSSGDADPTCVLYIEAWSSEESLRKQVRSDRFLHLLGLMESASEPPQLKFELAEGTRGLDYVEEVRAGLTRRIREVPGSGTPDG